MAINDGEKNRALDRKGENGTDRGPRSFLNQSVQSIFSSPFLLLTASVILIFWAEVVVMFVLSFLPRMTVITEAFIDAMMLSLIAVPIYYLFFLRPIQLNVRELRRVENELRKHKLRLEETVQERTNELMKSNEQLKWEVEKRIEAEKALKSRMSELEQFFDLSVDRELKMKKLKEEVEMLKSRLSQKREYNE